MRGILVAIFGGLGLGAFWRRYRRKPAADGWQGELGPDPAEGLRAKLAQTKPAQTDPAGQTEPVAGEPAEERAPVASGDAEASPLDPELRRRNVHERARASLDELK